MSALIIYNFEEDTYINENYQFEEFNLKTDLYKYRKDYGQIEHAIFCIGKFKPFRFNLIFFDKKPFILNLQGCKMEQSYKIIFFILAREWFL